MRWFLGLLLLLTMTRADAWDNDDFDLYPIVVRAGRVNRLTIDCKDAGLLREPERLVIDYVRGDGMFDHRTYAYYDSHREIPFEIIDETTLALELNFDGEMEYAFRIFRLEGDTRQPRQLANLKVYALREDLWRLRPWKGDVHMHSRYSDGKGEPAEVAAYARCKGLDFMALSDHVAYRPSLLAIEAMAALPTELRCYPGEEVHAPRNPVHIVNFGGSFGVSDWFRDHPEEYQAAFQAKLATIPADDNQVAREDVASSEVVFDQIRAGGGIAIFSHPYYRMANRVYIMDDTAEWILKRRNFDAVELIGGYEKSATEDNALMLSRYLQLLRDGNHLPVVGASDGHTYDPESFFYWYYTIVFAPSVDFGELSAAILDHRSVAVENVDGRDLRVWNADFRLARYAYFLLHEYFPKHDALCREEGELLLRAVRGDETAVPELDARCYAVAELMKKYFQADGK